MATSQGFIQKIEVNRGGQVTATLILTDGTIAAFTIQDLDGDPERFNERLSKLGLLRDAMNRAEPVEIEHDSVNGSEEIERIVRITRDDITLTTALTLVEGIVLSVQVTAQTLISAGDDSADVAVVQLLGASTGLQSCTLNLQTPERLVAKTQLEMLLAAQANGDSVQLMVQSEDYFIRTVSVGSGSSDSSQDNALSVSGFVETLGLIPASGGGGLLADFATATFTTAPDFSGPGNTVSPTAFTPQLMTFLVPKTSETYDLFEAGLRDNLRMRVLYMQPLQRSGNNNGRTTSVKDNAPAKVTAADTNGAGNNQFLIVTAAELVAPLASASRPVWITISRESLDEGPDGCGCTDGVPSSDLSVKTLRDLRIPYKAVWKGLGCFNHGVYRFQFNQSSGITLIVCCEKKCIYPSDDKSSCFGYACVSGDCDVVIEIDDWTCDKDFQIDVYRVR